MGLTDSNVNSNVGVEEFKNREKERENKTKQNKHYILWRSVCNCKHGNVEELESL
jgi:hypothetical protein